MNDFYRILPTYTFINVSFPTDKLQTLNKLRGKMK